jgi:hypothetical protein
MNVIPVAELMAETERELRSALEGQLVVASKLTFSEETYRGGFEVEFSCIAGSCKIVYSDMQFEAKCNGKEIFGVRVHEGFEGNMFSREHLREYLPRIAISISIALRQQHALG